MRDESPIGNGNGNGNENKIVENIDINDANNTTTAK